MFVKREKRLNERNKLDKKNELKNLEVRIKKHEVRILSALVVK